MGADPGAPRPDYGKEEMDYYYVIVTEVDDVPYTPYVSGNSPVWASSHEEAARLFLDRVRVKTSRRATEIVVTEQRKAGARPNSVKYTLVEPQTERYERIS